MDIEEEGGQSIYDSLVVLIGCLKKDSSGKEYLLTENMIQRKMNHLNKYSETIDCHLKGEEPEKHQAMETFKENAPKNSVNHIMVCSRVASNVLDNDKIITYIKSESELKESAHLVIPDSDSEEDKYKKMDKASRKLCFLMHAQAKLEQLTINKSLLKTKDNTEEEDDSWDTTEDEKDPIE